MLVKIGLCYIFKPRGWKVFDSNAANWKSSNCVSLWFRNEV